MPSRVRKHARRLELSCSFEANRMAQACLANAYEYVVPTRQGPLPVAANPDARRVPALGRRAGGVAW